MSKWLGYTVELFSNGQWFNIDQWHRHANGELRHRYLYTAPERDIFSSAHDELALSKERICFSDLAAETQDIIKLSTIPICSAEPKNPDMIPSKDSFSFFHIARYSGRRSV